MLNATALSDDGRVPRAPRRAAADDGARGAAGAARVSRAVLAGAARRLRWPPAARSTSRRPCGRSSAAELVDGAARRRPRALPAPHRARRRTASTSRTSLGDCSRQRAAGRRRPARTPARSARRCASSSVPVGEVLASPFCRTVETAELAFGRADREDGLLTPTPDTHGRTTRALRELLERASRTDGDEHRARRPPHQPAAAEHRLARRGRDGGVPAGRRGRSCSSASVRAAGVAGAGGSRVRPTA